MPKRTEEKLLCMDDLRHAEYYGMLEVFDDLYARSAKGEVFTDLMDIILSRENILLAYRNIKTNTGSKTQGTDHLTIKDIGRLTPDEVVDKVRFILTGSVHGYRSKPLRRIEIPKAYDPTKTRPLGIPCIWDRLIQQCIKQVLDPICAAKFSKNSHAYRPNMSTETALAAMYHRMNICHLQYVIEFDIKGFFDNVDHSKLIKQMWTMGIRDTVLIDKIKRILKAPIKMPDGSIVISEKGTPQGGIISPLLANIVLNELDHWIESQWENNPVINNYSPGVNKNGSLDKGSAYRAMRKTNLKEMYIVRYADDFRIFCKTKNEAKRIKIAVTQWLQERLKLEVSPEKTRIVNTRRKYTEFLGIKAKLRVKGKKWVVVSHIADKHLNLKKQALVNQAKCIAKPRKGKTRAQEAKLYNSMVMGMQNYYSKATMVSEDCSKLAYAVNKVLHNRLQTQRGKGLAKTGRKLSKVEQKRYGKSKQLRYLDRSGEPIYPIGYTQFKKPMMHSSDKNVYTEEGRKQIHTCLRINNKLLLELMRAPPYGASAEFADNRISLCSAQWGKCAVSGIEFKTTSEIHCHHIIPRSKGGSDKYDNLILVHADVHKLIHATELTTIQRYLEKCNLTNKQLKKVNELRVKAGLQEIKIAKTKAKLVDCNR